MTEAWLPVPSLPGILASSFGRIKLPESEAKMPHGGYRKYATKPTFGCKKSSRKNAKHVYLGVCSWHFGNLKVHQLVCEAFHGPKPHPKSVVIHKDEDGFNNVPENLKWGTQKENLNMPNFISYCQSRTGDNSPVTKGLKSA